jgi:hypothetical protein
MTLTRIKEGAGHAEQADRVDAQKQERTIGNTIKKGRIKGKESKERQNGERARQGNNKRREGEERKGQSGAEVAGRGGCGRLASQKT